MRRLVIQRLVRSLGVVVVEVARESVAHFVDRRVPVRVDVFVLHRSPQTLREDVVHAPAAAVHADENIVRFQNVRVRLARVLHALIGVVDVGRPQDERVG